MMTQIVTSIFPRREPLAAEVVEACYRVMLGREPENKQVVRDKTSFSSYEDLIESFLISEEFVARIGAKSV
jgi:hypothetical protein